LHRFQTRKRSAPPSGQEVAGISQLETPQVPATNYRAASVAAIAGAISPGSRRRSEVVQELDCDAGMPESM